MRILPLLIALGLFYGNAGVCQSAIDPTRVYGDSDKHLPIPVRPTRQAQDASAIQLVSDFLHATHLSKWSGLEASGTIVLAGDPTPHPAHLYLRGSSSYRLDLDDSDAKTSTIVSGMRAVQMAQGKGVNALPSDVAYGGLLAFPRLLATGYPLQTSTVIDQGTIASSQGTSLRRITIADDTPEDLFGSPSKTVDLLFSPDSHYLSAATAYVRIDTRDASYYFLETDFDSYTDVSGSYVPMHISQSLNGQQQWSLDLNQVSIGAPADATLFSF